VDGTLPEPYSSGRGVAKYQGKYVAASAKAVANRLLDLAARDGKKIDPLQMQKLLYLAEGWSLAVNGTSLFSENIEAWDNGPVVPDIYFALRGYGARPIVTKLVDLDDSGELVEASGSFTANEQAVIETVWSSYQNWTGPQLIRLTHEERSPWHTAYYNNRNERNMRINRLDMRDWFDNLAEKAEA
jgi:uncharacterized phage-associated protein